MSRLTTGNTPKQEAISIAMEVVRRAFDAPEDWVESRDYPLTEVQKRGIKKELARIHNRIGNRFDGDWQEIEA